MCAHVYLLLYTAAFSLTPTDTNQPRELLRSCLVSSLFKNVYQHDNILLQRVSRCKRGNWLAAKRSPNFLRKRNRKIQTKRLLPLFTVLGPFSSNCTGVCFPPSCPIYLIKTGLCVLYRAVPCARLGYTHARKGGKEVDCLLTPSAPLFFSALAAMGRALETGSNKLFPTDIHSTE